MDSAGTVFATDRDGAPDGRNARLVFTPLTGGEYVLRIHAEANRGAYLLSVDELAVAADFNADTATSAADIDLLHAAIGAQSQDMRFDLNQDQLVDQKDADQLIERILLTRRGDADLKGAVDFVDFVVLANHYGQTGGWAEGDFDGDGTVDFADFALLADEYGHE
jgi:hypothetical protein